MPPRPRKKPEKAETPVDSTVPNALRRAPSKRGFARDESPKVDPPGPLAEVPAEIVREIEELRAAGTAASDLATGRGLTYEWEIFYAALSTRVRAVELGGGGGGGGLRFVHQQTVPSASWAIQHDLATKPAVTVVANDGQEMHAEVRYPDDNNTLIVFSAPYAGTAYLCG